MLNVLYLYTVPNLQLKSFTLRQDVTCQKCDVDYFQMTYTLYQGTRLGLALKEALEEMEVIPTRRLVLVGMQRMVIVIRPAGYPVYLILCIR